MTDERDTLPPGWSMSERGPVSPSGRVYDSIPAGYEIADLGIFDEMLTRLSAAAGSTNPDADDGSDKHAEGEPS